MRARHVDRARAECVLADRLLRRGFLAVFAAVLVSMLAVLAVGHTLSGNAVSGWNILSPEGQEYKRCLNCNSPKRVLPSVCCSHCSWRSSMSERNGGSGILWFLTGLGIGAVVGILYAPQSGNETREILMAKAEEG